MVPKKLVAAFDCNPNVSPSAPINWKKLASFMMDFALVFLMVIIRTMVVEPAPEPDCLLTLLMMRVRSGSVTIWLEELPPGTGVGERMTIGPAPCEIVLEVVVVVACGGCCVGVAAGILAFPFVVFVLPWALQAATANNNKVQAQSIMRFRCDVSMFLPYLICSTAYKKSDCNLYHT